MSIQEFWRKLKGLSHDPEYQIAGLILIVAISAFSLGRSSVGEMSSFSTDTSRAAGVLEAKGAQISPIPEEGKAEDETLPALDPKGYVASKSGTKYHLPWCGSAKSIKEENKIWFETKEEAEKAGYTPAANCKGI